jgi:S1-C subfamily serine protease
VVAGAERVSVQLADGREYDAYLMGTDPGTDVAVLRIEVPETDPPLPVLPLGNSDDMVVGDWAVAVGNPLGELQGSFTVGVISATGRSNLRIAGGGPTYQDFIQTDASINFGNSGGPLVNIRGEAIGINSAVNPTGQGLGFAIPINMARDVAVELIGSGTVRRGFLGIVPQELTDAARDTWRVDSAVLGVLVGNVQEDTPASRGGLEEGDVITQFNGREVSDVPEFRRIVADAGVGATVPIRISRDGRERGLEVVLVLRPDTPEPPPDAESVGAETWLGARFQDVTPELVALFNLHRSEGVVLTRIDMGRPAAAGGLRVGDLVLELNERQVKDVGGLQAAFKDAVSNGDRLVFRVQRGRQTTRIDILWEG